MLLLFNDVTLTKNDLVDATARMITLTRQELGRDPEVAKEYYEKVEHLIRTVRMVIKFEKQILLDLDVD
jgi:hypothetical protein